MGLDTDFNFFFCDLIRFINCVMQVWSIIFLVNVISCFRLFKNKLQSIKFTYKFYQNCPFNRYLQHSQNHHNSKF